jgi:serine/threonine-protein kinase RsbW
MILCGVPAHAPIAATLSSRDDAMSRVLQLVERVGTEYALPGEVLTNLRIALDEIVTNIAKYAYRDDAAHDITIHFEMRGSRLATTVEDDGVAFDPLRAQQPDLAAPLASREVGGLGVHFVRNLMSSVAYERVGGRNRLTLEQDVTTP